MAGARERWISIAIETVTIPANSPITQRFARTKATADSPAPSRLLEAPDDAAWPPIPRRYRISIEMMGPA